MEINHLLYEEVIAEKNTYPPPPGFARHAFVHSQNMWETLRKEASQDPESFWAKQAEKWIWTKPWEKVLDWKLPFAQWFVGGELNVSENCLDRHLQAPTANKPAIIWEGEPGEIRTLTYVELHKEVCKCANALSSLGIQAGDRVAIYMPMVPEVAIAMLACARLGAPHNVVFGGFAPEALRNRLVDSGAKILITADGGFRRGREVPLKSNADEALRDSGDGRSGLAVEHVIVLKRTGAKIPFTRGRDLWWHELMQNTSPTCRSIPVPANHPLFMLYTSGTTGKPKGVVHRSGGYLVGTATTTQWIFDLKPEDKYWCTADVGWITGHSYVVYGPLACGATVFMYEGAPNHPQPNRFWDIIERHQISIFYTSPTAIRACIKWGDAWPKKHDLSCLRLLGTVGEPINPEVWRWYHKTIGKGRCPIVDTWWQTETGMIMISPAPGAVPTKPGSATLPLPGVDAAIVDEKGNTLPHNQPGLLVIRRPWPAMMMTLYQDDARYQQAYWSRIPGLYFTGDQARMDEDGYFWISGRVDDVMNVSGHRLGTAEIESALVKHPAVAEAAVIAIPHDLKGQTPVAFVTLVEGQKKLESVDADISQLVDQEIGKFARPEKIIIVDALPKTRSGKIMRRLLRRVALGEQDLGDTTTLEDASVLEGISQSS